MAAIDNPGTLWGLKIPLELRPVVQKAFPEQNCIFPSVLHPDGSQSAEFPEALVQRILQKGPSYLLHWKGIGPSLAQRAQLEARQVHIVPVDAARLWGPQPEPAHRPLPYGLRFDLPLGMLLPLALPGIATPPELRQKLFDDYLALNLTAVNEGGALPGQELHPLLAALRDPAVFVVAGDDHPGTPLPLKRLVALTQEAVAAHPGRPVVFLTNGHPAPAPDDPRMAEIARLATVLCSERWSRAMLSRCGVLYTLDASAALDSALAGIPTVVRAPGVLQDLAQGRIRGDDAFFAHLIRNTLFGDPLQGQLLPLDQVLPVIARRQTMIPAASLSATQRWKPEAVSDPALKPALEPIHRPTANYSAFDPAKILPPPQDLLLPGWLKRLPEAPKAELLLLQGETALLAGLDRALNGLGAPWAELRLQPQERPEQLSDFALYQPELCLQLMRKLIRASGARRALLVDLDAPEVRLFARACAREGLERLHIPSQAGIGEAAPSLPVLCETVLAWHPDHAPALATAGIAPARILPVALGAPDLDPTPGLPPARPVLFWLAGEKFPRAQLRLLVNTALACSDQMEQPVRFLLDQPVLAQLDEKSFEAIATHPLADYRLMEPAADAPEAAVLACAALVCTPEAPVIRQAAQLGLPVFDLTLDPELSPEAGQTALRRLLLAGFDRLASEAAAGTAAATVAEAPAGAPSLAARLRDWLARAPEAPDTELKPGRIPYAMSTIANHTWHRESRHVLAMLGTKRHSEVENEGSLTGYLDADVWLQWGLRYSRRKAKALAKAQRLGIPTLFVEDGFIRSVGIGLSGESGLSITYDDLTSFYDATQPSRLELRLNEAPELSEAELARARALIARISERKITKYNFAPYRRVTRADPKRPAILVVDQRGGDVSIEKGLASEATFAKMVETALGFAKTHDILIKTHPDANVGGRESAIGAEVLNRAAKNPAVTLVTEDMNPFSLLDIVEKVFVVSSGMGFEALIAGREVWCFGAPFYSGWGLTRDHVALPRRKARLTLEQIFHVFYIERSRYFDPVAGAPGEIEEVIAHIDRRRPWKLEACQELPWSLTPPPAAPTAAAQTSLASRLAPYQTLWLFGVSLWKLPLYRKLFAGKTLHLVDEGQDYAAIPASERPLILVWGFKHPPGLAGFAVRNKLPLLQMEDGFLRSVGLGADYAPPRSLCLDGNGLYYNARRPSDLENLLQSHDFGADPALLPQAAALRRRIVETGLSKYNLPVDPRPEPFGPKTKRRVLVVGQVEDDASITYGAAPPITNNDLVRLARAENPEAEVIYRIHPDVLAKLRPELSDPAEVKGICRISSEPIAIADALREVDQVYTITSLVGFEALLRDIPVTTLGMPFYAGWGLTDDRMACPRRSRRLSLDELFAGAYLLYPQYFDPTTGKPASIEAVIEALLAERALARLARLS